MKIIFATTAYTAIGFSNHYTGFFTIEGNTCREVKGGVWMSIILPKKWSCVGRELSESKSIYHS